MTRTSTMKIATPTAARQKLAKARLALATAQEALRAAEANVAQCERDVVAADAEHEAKARANAEKEAAKARAKAEREAAKADKERAKTERDAAKAAKPKSVRTPKAPPPDVSSIVLEIRDFYERVADPAVSHADIDATVDRLTKGLKKDALVTVAEAVGVAGMKNKANEEIVGKIRKQLVERKGASQRASIIDRPILVP